MEPVKSIYINGLLYLNKSLLLDSGISSNTIFSAQQRGVNGWKFEKLKGVHALYIAYEPLKDEYTQRIKQWLRSEYGHEDIYRYHRSTLIEQFIRPDDDAINFYREYNNGTLGKSLQERYHKAAMVLNLVVRYKEGNKTFRSQFGATTREFYNTIGDYIKVNSIDLPGSYERLTTKVNEYKPDVKAPLNYACIVSGKIGNKNTEKISGEAAEWLIAQYALPTKIKVPALYEKYEVEAAKRGWKTLESKQAIHLFLSKPEIKRQWFGGRHGFDLAKERYGYQLATILPTMRDALWYADGTKLNYFDKLGKLRASYTVYKVMDAFSEVILGWHISLSEDHVSQYHAFKNAMRFSGYKPYELKVDNQSGHKKIKKELIDKLTHVGVFTQPYNGKSKTIESVLGRFQQQVMREDWYFTGQNITAKSLDSRANIEFIADNIKQLPSIEEIKATFQQRVDKWNNKPHFAHKIPKIQLYLESYNPKTKPFTAIDMVETFWLTKSGVRDQGITYYNHGITLEITVEDKVKYKNVYEVLDSNGMPDLTFRTTNLYRQFHIKYDLDDLSYVRLYRMGNNGLEFVAIAEDRLKTHRALQDQEDGERVLIGELLNIRREEIEGMKDGLLQLEERTKVAARDLVPVTIGEYKKQESYWSEEPEGERSIWDKI